jgi:plastocyanin
MKLAPAPMLVALALACPAVAAASEHTYTGRIGPIALPGFEVGYDTAHVKGPAVDGFITGMTADVVDRRGERIPVDRVMLHHVLFSDRGTRDGERHDGACPSIPRERIYGTGEEHQRLRLPPGYGIPIHARDRWQAAWMLMNHRARRRLAYVEYRIRVETSKRLVPVKGFWLGVTGCRTPVYTVPGGGSPGSLDTRSSTWTVPTNGRLVAGGAHLHGGAKRLRLLEPRCGNRAVADSAALYGLPDDLVYRVLPVLHEPGPISTSWFTTESGIPLEKGERIVVSGEYDAEFAHTRVMAIGHVYMALGGPPPRACAPLPGDLASDNGPVPGRTEPPYIHIPLTALGPGGSAQTIDRPPGPETRLEGSGEVSVRRLAFNRPNLSIPLGASVTWNFDDPVRHNVTTADGPVGFGSLSLRGGDRYAHHFTRPGTYRLYCTLHPVAMQQAIDVRPHGIGAAASLPSASRRRHADELDW